MSNIARATDLATSAVHAVFNDLPEGSPPDVVARNVVRFLNADGLITPAPQIIRTVEELEALDPDTLLIPEGFVTPIRRQSMDNFGIRVSDSYHAVVVASGEHYRACREALEES